MKVTTIEIFKLIYQIITVNYHISIIKLIIGHNKVIIAKFKFNYITFTFLKQLKKKFECIRTYVSNRHIV